MDKVRVALDWLKRHHFWVLSVLVALISVVCWAKASSKMETAFKTNKGAIEGQFSSVKGVRNDPFHPNEDVNTKQAGQTKDQAKEVAALWDRLYKRQSTGVLTWPKSLGPRFAETIEKLPFAAPIPEDLRNIYRDYVDRYFPELPKIVNARVMEATESGGGGPSGYGRSGGPEGGMAAYNSTNGATDDNDYICEWLDQGFVREKLYFRDRPNSLKIWVTQEALWVYKTLLEIIANTNQAAGATRMSNAAVRTIRELQVGKEAAAHSRTPGRLLISPAQQASGAGPGGVGPEGGAPAGPGPTGPGRPGGPEGGPEGMMAGGPGGPGATGQMTEEQEQAYLLSGRYLDLKGNPIAFAGAAAAAPADPAAPPTAATAPDLSAFGVEYKRLPVRMVLRMDQRRLPQLISFCASQPLQVEVQEVRINVAEATGQGGPSGGFSGPSGGAGPQAPDRSGVQAFPQNPELADVIIQGTIYIFNKPNASVLETTDQQPLANTNGAQ